MMAKSLNHKVQFLVKFKVEDVYIFYVFLTTTITRLNFNRFYATESNSWGPLQQMHWTQDNCVETKDMSV
jgi:hypothetical protein